jgi:ferrous iron transport protein B
MAEDFARRVAIAGNPNTGKTTIFNALTGLRQKVGNYPGVTVERKTGKFFGSHGEAMELVDLPGSYSLQVRSPDEAVARDLLLGRLPGEKRPDLIIAVVDASNLERHLYLAVQMLELGIPVVVALNMVDVAEERGLVIDLVALRERLGVPVIPMVASKGVGLIELKQSVSRTPLAKPEHRAQLPIVFESEAANLGKKLTCPPETSRLEAMLLLSLDDKAMTEQPLEASVKKDVLEAQSRLRTHGLDPLSAPIDARYDWVAEICSFAVRRKGEGSDGLTATDRIDQVLTHKVWGWVAFAGMMALVFFCIFTVASYPQDWIEAAIGALGKGVGNMMAEGALRSLLVDGVIAGVGAVVVFLPQILILFLFLGLLEDSGYMARAAFIMDRLFSKVGLHGKSFVPMLSSFACAIPGVMATRTIENRKDRLVTILVAPLMSCSARLPVYAVMVALLLPFGSPWQRAGVTVCMYFLGFIMAFVMAWIFKKTLLKSETPMLLLELPPYRRPAASGILLRMWERGMIFLKRAGTVILALNVILWALLHYPEHNNPTLAAEKETADAKAETLKKDFKTALGDPLVAAAKAKKDEVTKATEEVGELEAKIAEDPKPALTATKAAADARLQKLQAELETARKEPRVAAALDKDDEGTKAGDDARAVDLRIKSDQLANSYGGRAGKVIAPLIAPLGYDWKIGIGLVGSFAAREVFVSTMAQVYSLAEEDESGEKLEDEKLIEEVQTAMAAEKRADGSPMFTPLVCIGLMVFYVLAMQCISTVAVVKRETGGWKWALFQLGYMTALAWIGAFIVFQGGRLLGFH